MPRITPFRKYPEQYENWFIKNIYAYVSELNAIRSFVPEQGIGLDIGVGTGRFAEPLGIEIGIEPCREVGRIARSKGIVVIEAVAENLPFHNQVFDFVLMVTTVCFLDDIKSAFKETHRVLKNKGNFIIGFVDKKSPLGKKYELHKKQSRFYNEATFFTVKEITSVLKESGFKNFRYVQTIFQDLDNITAIEPVKDGFSEGSFVVISASY